MQLRLPPVGRPCPSRRHCRRPVASWESALDATIAVAWLLLAPTGEGGHFGCSYVKQGIGVGAAPAIESRRLRLCGGTERRRWKRRARRRLRQRSASAVVLPGKLALEIAPGFGVESRAGDGDDVQCLVELAIAAAVQSVAMARPDKTRIGATPASRAK